MSYLVREIYNEGVNRTTLVKERLAFIIADDASSLPVDTSDMVYVMGSKALTIDTGNNYIKNSSGSWVLQPSNNAWQNVYTKTEIDNIITDINTLDMKQTLALVHLINESGKNRVKPTVTTQTVSGITWTVNADGTITANGTATANSYVTVQALPADYVFDGNYFLCGCPSGGGASTYALYVARGSYTKYDYGDGVMLSSSTDDLNKNLIAIVYSGQTVTDLVFKPMICKKVYWDITHKYMPYCPTLPELYAMM